MTTLIYKGSEVMSLKKLFTAIPSTTTPNGGGSNVVVWRGHVVIPKRNLLVREFEYARPGSGVIHLAIWDATDSTKVKLFGVDVNVTGQSGLTNVSQLTQKYVLPQPLRLEAGRKYYFGTMGITATGQFSMSSENPVISSDFDFEEGHHMKYFGTDRNVYPTSDWPASYYGGFNIVYSEAVTAPNTPTSMTRPNTAKVGNTVNVSWTSVPVPSQPEGTTLTSNQVFYEVDFYDGTKWVAVTSKTSLTNVNYTIPAMADSNLAKFRVRAFVEAYGQRHYGGYRESATMTIYNNNKPTVPTAFSAPITSARYRVGFNYTVSWGASTDLDNDPITYQLDFFNGVSWSNVANGLQTTNRSFIVPTGPDTFNAQFRVRAYDGRDYSDYRYSDKFEVFNNTPPNTPRPFTKPESDEMRIIDLQTAYAVSWGPADVEEGETAKYEVSFRGSALDNWVVVQDINNPNATNTSMQHILPNVQDSETAQYRVRAYDGQEYGGYTESNYFSMSGNKVTNTSGFNQELMDRMAINQEVRLSWQPATTARNTQVVYDIEIFDGFIWKEIAYNVPSNSIVFRIPPMKDTPNAKLRIRSKTAFQYGGYVESAWFETKTFTIVNFFIFDSIAVPFLNDVQKKENADYLRQKVNDMRIVNDLPPLVYTDPVIIRYETAIKAVHFDEMERGILECFDSNPRGKFSNVRTEQELRKMKEYADQAELIQELPQRIDFICKALMNQ